MKKSTKTPITLLLPLVEFDYPDSSSNQMKPRFLRVTEANVKYIKGYEIPDVESKFEGKFKQFSKNRIARNGVSLIRF